MSVFAVLGPITFQALSSPQTLESSRGWNFAEHKVVESDPLLQWTGNELETISLDILLHVSINNPMADLLALRAAGDAHLAMPLVMGNGLFCGYFVLTKMSESAKQLADDGSIVALMLKLELKEYSLSIEIDSNAPPQPDNDTPGMIVGALQPGQTVAGVVNANGVVTFPAPQAGTSAIVNNPAPAAPPEGADPDLVATSTITRMDPSAGAPLA